MKLRSVNTKFWDDSFVIELSPNEKLLFLYLLTNPLTSTLGIYEITLKRMSFDTGLKIETISKALEGFKKSGKAIYLDKQNLIILPNFIKNQSMNSNMEKGAINSYNDLPNDVKPEGYRNTIESFETLLKALKAFGNINIIETEVKSKDKNEDEPEKIIFPEFPEFLNYAKTLKTWHTGFENQLEAKFNQWSEEGWRDGHGNKIKNWKTKLQNTIIYFKNGNDKGFGTRSESDYAETIARADAIIDRAFGKK